MHITYTINGLQISHTVHCHVITHLCVHFNRVKFNSEGCCDHLSWSHSSFQLYLWRRWCLPALWVEWHQFNSIYKRWSWILWCVRLTHDQVECSWSAEVQQHQCVVCESKQPKWTLPPHCTRYVDGVYWNVVICTSTLYFHKSQLNGCDSCKSKFGQTLWLVGVSIGCNLYCLLLVWYMAGLL